MLITVYGIDSEKKKKKTKDKDKIEGKCVLHGGREGCEK